MSSSIGVTSGEGIEERISYDEALELLNELGRYHSLDEAFERCSGEAKLRIYNPEDEQKYKLKDTAGKWVATGSFDALDENLQEKMWNLLDPE